MFDDVVSGWWCGFGVVFLCFFLYVVLLGYVIGVVW